MRVCRTGKHDECVFTLGVHTDESGESVHKKTCACGLTPIEANAAYWKRVNEEGSDRMERGGETRATRKKSTRKKSTRKKSTRSS